MADDPAIGQVPGRQPGIPTGHFSPAILHLDMDAFFAAVEVLDDPQLEGKPVIVGGSGARGVVASCNYEARAYGVRSAMPSARAKRLCPHAVFVDGTYARYSEVSGQLHTILRTATPLVEPIGLDEAFLDVTGSRRLLGSAEQIAHRLRNKVHDELKLDCSIGIGRSKLIAKLASRAAKPRAGRQGVAMGHGVLMIAPEDELGFLHPLPVEALWGVGPATATKLHALGARTVGDLSRLPEDVLVRRLGQAQGSHLLALAGGHDPSPVVPDRPTKSVGHEETFSRDETDPQALQAHAVRMAESVASALRNGKQAGRTVSVKVRYSDFSLVTRSHTLLFAADTGPAIAAVAGALLEAVDLRDGVRLLGVSVSGLQAGSTSKQLSFDIATDPDATGQASSGDGSVQAHDEGGGLRAARLQSSWQEVTSAVDAIRSRFGRHSVGRASMVGDDGLEVPDRRGAPWGPRAPEPD